MPAPSGCVPPLPRLLEVFRPVVLAFVFCLLCVWTTPARADWLVLRDGSTVETAGPWRVQGRLVVFDLPGGTLASLRLDAVDLQASESRTAAARAALEAPPPAEQPVPRKARIVLTDADIPRGRLEPDAEGPAEAEGGSTERPAAAANDLVVLSWESGDSPNGDGVRIYGTVQNQGTRTLTNTGIRVHLYNSDGELITSAEGQIGRPALPAHARANFTVSFPNVFSFAAVKFDPHFRAFEARRAGAEDPDPTALEDPTPEPPPR